MAQLKPLAGSLAATITLGCAGALAQDTIIDTGTTAPLVTSTEGSIAITTDGSITLANADAITIDSNNNVTVDGTLTLDGDTNGIAAVRIIGNRTVDISMNGDVSLDSSAEIDDDGNAGNFPQARFGLTLDAGGSVVGDITLGSNSSIALETDQGAALALFGNVTGDITIGGDSTGSTADTINVTGDSSHGLLFSSVDGSIDINASTRMDIVGVNTHGIETRGAVTGAFRYGGIATVTGFTIPDPGTSADVGSNDAGQIARTSGDGLRLFGAVGGGVLIDGVLDTDGDGVFDASADAGQSVDANITVFGAGAAVRIGDGTTPVALGALTPEDNLPTDYGTWSFINRGDLSSSSSYEGIAVNTVVFDNVNFAAGVRNERDIVAISTAADARTLQLLGTTALPLLDNRDDILADADGASGNALALSIEAAASLTSLENDGDIDALSENGDAYGILDLSGTLTDITNFGRIQAVGGTENDDTSILSRAIDVSTNTSGVSIANTAPAVFDDDLNDDGTIDVTLADFGIINGDVVTGSGDDTFFSNAGPVVGDLILSDGNDTVTFQQEAILNGSIDVGSGNDTVTFNNATITSDVNFGAGTDVFEILNGTSWSGSFSSTGDLSVRSNSSSVSLTDASNASLSNLTVENGSTLLFDISASTDSAPRIVASDTVTISDDSSIDVAFQTGFTGTIESTLIQASTLNINLAEVGLVGEGGSSFLVASSLGLAQDDPNALVLTRRRKSGDEVGIFTEEQAAFEAAITGIETDTELTQEIYALSTQDDFLDAYRQLLPPTIDMPLIAARAQTDTIGSIINDRTNLTGEGRSNSARFWLQEQIYYVDRAEGRGFTGFDGGGLVVSLGADIPFLGFDVLGLAGSVASSRFDEKLGEDLPVTRTALGIDLYGAKKLGKLSIDARGGIATVSSSSSRNVEINDVRRNFEGDWEGSQTSAHARVQYEFGLGNFEIIPLASVDYLSISEDGYTEDNPDNSLALSVDDRDGESLRVNSGLTLALTRRRGPSNLFSPGTVGFNETTMRYAFTAGTSFELASDPLSATYRYNDGESFTLEAELEETSYFGGLDATYSNGAINFTGGIYGNFGEDTTIGSLRFSLGAIW